MDYGGPHAATSPPLHATATTNNNNNTGRDGDVSAPPPQDLTERASAPTSPAFVASRFASEVSKALSPIAQRPPGSPLRRASSNNSLNQGQMSPVLARKTSASSLRNYDAPGTPRGHSSRRPSLNTHASSPTMAKFSQSTLQEEKPPRTAASVATECLSKELALHETGEHLAASPTLVFLHDSCYGHRYSRPKTSKASLSTIVERPERILAGVRGVSAAYVRLGSRHEGGSRAPHPAEEPVSSLPFIIRKTSRFEDITSPAVTKVHGTEWMKELQEMCNLSRERLATTGKELARIEGKTPPGRNPKRKLHEGDLYLCPESLDALRGALGGVLDAVDNVFTNVERRQGPSRAFVCVRPPGHHCSDDMPSGFCWLNNVHVGIQHAAMTYGLTHAAIIDFDLHHGDGSQDIAWTLNEKSMRATKAIKKSSIGYFSLHDINSYPCEWGEPDKVRNASMCIENAHGQSIWNVHLQPWRTEAEFWKLYETKYVVLLEKAREFLRLHTQRLSHGINQPAPKAAIFLSSGFDASQWESHGMQRHKVNVPTDFYARFTKDVVRMASEEGLGVEGRVISVLEGGYSDRALMSGIFSHICGLCSDTQASVKMEDLAETGLGIEMSQKLGKLSLQEVEPAVSANAIPYDTQWWNEENLNKFEGKPEPKPEVPAKTKSNGQASYTLSTQASEAKISENARARMSSSSYRETARPPSPPPPPVDWIVATHELSKLLIPTDRETKSCQAEELSEARFKKEKAAAQPPLAEQPAKVPSKQQAKQPATQPTRQTRGRKAKISTADDKIASEDDKAPQRVVSRSDRRKTIANMPVAPAEDSKASKPNTRRRTSMASSVGSASEAQLTSRAPSEAPPVPALPPQRGSSSGVQVKKTRVSTSRAETAKAKAAPQPESERRASGVPRPKKAAESVASSSSAPAPSNKENDVDQLTSGLKRISLKVPSKEEHDARQQQKAAEEAAKKAASKPITKKATTVPKAPRAATNIKKSITKLEKAASSTSTEPSTINVAVPKAPSDLRPQQLPAAQRPSSEALQELQKTQLLSPVISTSNASSPLASPSLQPPDGPNPMDIHPDMLPGPPPSGLEDLIHHKKSPPRPDTPPPPPPAAAPIQFSYYNPEPTFQSSAKPLASNQSPMQLQWLPPNSDLENITSSPATSIASTPQQPKPSRELPVFSSSGQIPFGNAAGKPNEHAVEAPPKSKDPLSKIIKEEKDIWEVPDTPQK